MIRFMFALPSIIKRSLFIYFDLEKKCIEISKITGKPSKDILDAIAGRMKSTKLNVYEAFEEIKLETMKEKYEN